VKRSTFIKRSAALLGGLAVARRLPAGDAVAATETPEVLTVAPALERSFVANGGLCAPLTPYYDLPPLSARPIIDALPSFTAARGGIEFQGISEAS